MNSILVGRTPVFTRSLDLYAYDLRVCNFLELNKTWGENPAFLRLVTQKTPGFIRMKPNFPVPTIATDKYKTRCIPVFKMSELATPDSIRLANQWADLGCQICGELSASDNINHIPSFISICSVDAIKVSNDVNAQIEIIRGKNLPLLIRNMDTEKQFTYAKKMQFDWFHGRYFEQLTVSTDTEIPASKSAVLYLLARLQDPDIGIQSVETLVSQDITLSYKVIRLVNAAFFGLPKRVESIRRAVVFLGLNRVKNWASVLVVNSLDYQPRELLMTALVRARSCELLAQVLGRLKPEMYYIAGLFSMLDTLMDIPKAPILQKLNLAEEIEDALLSGDGAVGEVLRYVLAIEWGVCADLTDLPIEEDVAMQAYTNAVEWAEQVYPQIVV